MEVIFLHAFMDLAWDMFATSENVTSNTLVNIFRFTTLAFAVILSVRLAKKEGRYDLKQKLWINNA